MYTELTYVGGSKKPVIFVVKITDPLIESYRVRLGKKWKEHLIAIIR